MRKRLIEKFTKSKKGSLGYTLTELLVVIGIIAIVCAIAIPSVIAISRSLRFKQANDYAKSIFLAAQQNLTDMRAQGGLYSLATKAASEALRPNDSFPGEYKDEYFVTSNTQSSFLMVLPTGSVDASLLSDQVIVEYNPYTGNVYSVFYCAKKDVQLLDEYQKTEDIRDKAVRKAMLIGYYDGSGLNSAQIELEDTAAQVEFLNEQEGIVRITIPMPDAFYSTFSFQDFVEALRIKLTITGEMELRNGGVQTQSLANAEGASVGTERAVSFDLPTQSEKSSMYSVSVDGRSVVVEYPIDSLVDYGSFANLALKTSQIGETQQYGSKANQKRVSEITNEAEFVILPGENVTIQADVEFEQSKNIMVNIRSGILSGVNPMFEYLQPSGTEGKYVLGVANGRNLQNLNALAPSIAKNVESVVFTSDIYWNETVSYYNKEYGGGNYKNNEEEAPVRALPYFVPIHNESLFGTASFNYAGTGERTPVLSDGEDSAEHASIVGNVVVDGEAARGARVYYLNIDATEYDLGKRYYVDQSYTTGMDRDFAGLFGYVNTTIDNIHVVNPIVKGKAFTEDNNPATGALVGAAGKNVYIANCSTYIDKEEKNFNSAMMRQEYYNAEKAQGWYGVSGEGAVGGLVGYAKSHRTTNGALSDNQKVLAFNSCFAAVNVSGNMREATQQTRDVWDFIGSLWGQKFYGYGKDYGYTNGVGGLIGNSELTNFYKCYASGNVMATNTNGAQTFTGEIMSNAEKWLGVEADFLYRGRESVGAGGFVGTSHGTRYTNCFASGNVSAQNKSGDSKSQVGAGGFVGIMCIDESIDYGTASDDSTNYYDQHSVFTSCYSVGTVSKNGVKESNFSGANARRKLSLNSIAGNAQEIGSYAVADYYRLLPPYYRDTKGKTPSYESFYIFKDAYYLSGYYKKDEVQDNYNNCANAITYDDLVSLSNGVSEKFVEDRLAEIKKMPGYDTIFKNYENLKSVCKGKLKEAYAREYWRAADGNTTFGYERSGNYPFPILTGMPYYGNWPFPTAEVGLGYYEDYAETDTELHYYYFDRESSSQLTTKQDDVVIKDGYAIFAAENKTIKVAIQTEQKEKEFELKEPDGAFTSEGKAYHVFLLTDEVMQAAAKYTKEHPNEFYVPVTVKQGESNYTFYFNPNVARSQLFEGEAQPEDGKPVQNRFYIRSARQFAALEKMSSFWGADYVYEQQLNLDATQYNWSETDINNEKDESVAVSSIGNVKAPFEATYAASYMDANSNSAKYEIKGMTPKDAGFFGVIGEKGTVRDVIISCPAVTAKTDVDSAAVLAGENQGTISGVELILDGDVQITAKENAGILAGKTSGSITDCKVTEEKNQNVNVTLEAKYVGGLVGTAAGTEQNTISLDQCSLELTGALELKGTEAAAAGGFVGAASKVTADTVGVSAKRLTSSAKLVGGLVGNAEDTTITSGVLNLTNELAATDKASVAGGAAAQTSGSSFTGVQVTLNSLSGGSAAGFAYTAEDVKLDNCQVSLTGGISGTNGAAGVVGETSGTGSLRAVNGKLGTDVTSAEGQAAGFALNLKAGTTVQSCTVALNNTDIRASKQAAGFAISVGESVDGSSVRGKGSVSSTDAEAAGYAIDIAANVSNSYVTPAVADSDYQGNGNGNLTISGTNAAGFALRVGKGKTVNNCYTLGTIKGEQVYGFAGSNGGTISKSIANVDLYGTKQVAFVGSNEGSVTTSYGWYDDNGVVATATMDGKCVNSYFANLDSLLIAKESVTVYGADGTKTNVTPATLQVMKLDGFKNPDVLNAYPYEADLYENGKASYPYPMLRDHYGDWITPPQYAYGVAYYEIYDNDSFKLHLVDLSDQEKTVEGKNFSEKKGDFDHTGTIKDAGYAVFRQESDSKLDNYCGAKIDGLEHSSTINETTIINYSFFKLNAKNEATVAGKKTVTVDTRFADAFDVTDGTYQVRTAEQLANIGAVTASFNQTHDIVTKDFVTAAIASGKIYDGHGWKLTVTDQTKKWLDVSGTVQNLNLEVLASKGTAVFGTVDENVSLNAVTMGQAASAQPQEAAAQAQTDNTSGTTAPTTPAVPKFALAEAVSGNLNVGSVTVNGDVDTFIGGNAENVTINGATKVTGNVGTLVAGGTVLAKDITVGGNVTGGLIETTVGFTAGNVTVNGALNGKLVGTASGTVSLGDVTVGSIGEAGALIGRAEQTATIGNITVKGALSGKLVDVVAGTVSGAKVSEVKAQDINSLFGEVQENATVENFNIAVGSMAAPLVGGELEGALKGVTVKAGTVSGAQGILAATSSGTIEGCGVDVQAVTVSTDVFGGLVGKVTGGSLTGNTVEAGTITCTLGDKDVSIGGLVGEMSGGTLSGTSKATTVSGSIQVVVPEQTQNAQAVAVEEESSAAAEAAAEEGAEALDVKPPVYVIGGAVGKIIAGEDAEKKTTLATIRNVSAAVEISATGQNVATIGSFLGYAGAGTLDSCAATVDSSYEFLGGYGTEEVKLGKGLWKSETALNEAVSFESDKNDENGNYVGENYVLTETFDDETVSRVIVELINCTCKKGETTQLVAYGVRSYFYRVEDLEQSLYTVASTAVQGNPIKRSITVKKTEYNEGVRQKTDYYMLKDGKYHNLFIEFSPDKKYGVTTGYTVKLTDSDGNKLGDDIKAVRKQTSWTNYYYEAKIEEVYDLEKYDLGGKMYLAVKGGSNVPGIASEHLTEFEQRDELYSCLWTVEDDQLKNVKDNGTVWVVKSEMALTEDLTMQYVTKDGVTFNLYKVDVETADYKIRTFELVSDEPDYERQKVVYLAASQEASATSEIVPAGEITGGETQNNG